MNILEVNNLKKTYKIARSFQKPLDLFALRGVSFHLNQKETLAIVGESGCGKSTLAKILMKLEDPTAGDIKIQDQGLAEVSQKKLPNFLQMVFQDPSSSLNPRKKVFALIAEPLYVQGQLGSNEIKSKVLSVSRAVGINEELMNRYPHMMSGGQRQRVGIARALVTQPKALILDEPVSALDVSIQAQVLNLLLDLKDQQELSYIFISHDLSVVRFIADRVLVLYLGKVVELASKKELFEKPFHPYTQLLLKSSPQIKKSLVQADEKSGELPSPLAPPVGCAFASRCPKVTDLCLQKDPDLKHKNNRTLACHHVDI